ncbi:ATP-binding protein [uncultured Cohaesibacter sp.]|uniref:ATP-binding protein n=1 Tax=uncultured Cohaesibacter sp. TaxID=1002546 RepID=UPI00292F7CFF|nr:ATP-binding protein [uncultured Cohaesibacter sp.]
MDSSTDLPNRLSGQVMRLRILLGERQDSEHDALFLRVFLSTLFAATCLFMMLVPSPLPGETFQTILVFVGLYAAILLAEFVHLLHSPGISVGRRLLSIANDQFLFTAVAFIIGPSGVHLYPIYLWSLLAAGFRYGTPCLLMASLFSIVMLSAHYDYFGLWTSDYLICLSQLGGVVTLAIVVSIFLRSNLKRIADAQEASKAKSAYLEGISHEVRTPLHVIKGLSDLLGDTGLTTEQRRMLGTIEESGDTLLRLINHLLDYARAKNGKMPSQNEDFDLFALIGRLYRSFSPQALQKQIDLTVHFDPSLRRLYFGNSRFLEEILRNLLSNAVKFTEQGRVTIRASLIENNLRDHVIRFDVMDTGIGVSLDVQSRIFDRFTQSDDLVLIKFGGSGLGLALCREYADAMNGKIYVKSRLGEGSCFSLQVPIALGLSELGMDLLKEDQANPIKRHLAMITRDEALVGILKTEKLRCEHFADAQTALAGLFGRPSQGGPALLLVDRDMLGEDMARFKQQLADRAKDQCPHVVWICHEGESGRSLARTAAHLGLAYLPRNELKHRINKLVCLSDSLVAHPGRKGSVAPLQQDPAEKPLHILAADDSGTNRMVIDKMLTSLGHRVTLAENGEQALRYLQDGDFDLAFLDIRMPVLDGLEAARRFRAFADDKGLARRPALHALTADPSEQTRQCCREAGMTSCLLKPIERESLKHLIDQFILESPYLATGKAGHAVADKLGMEDMFANHVIEDLRDLGGEQFVVDLAHQFSEDGIAALKRLKMAVNNCDEEEFRDGSHALRSAAANIGARSVFDLCRTWRDITPAELHEEGEDHLIKLAGNLSEAIADLEHILSITLPKPEMDRTRHAVNA